MIPDLLYIHTQNPGVVGIGNVSTQNPQIYDVNIRDPYIRDAKIADTRIWMREPSQALPTEVPVTVIVGKPIVNIPGCVKVNKENTGRDPSKNKQLVNDDPKQNVVLCDGGMPCLLYTSPRPRD
mgnify:CR=1 FL=1